MRSINESLAGYTWIYTSKRFVYLLLTVLLGLLSNMPCVEMVCNSTAAYVCQRQAINSINAVQCDSSKVIQPLRDCVIPTIDTCTDDVKFYYNSVINNIQYQLDLIIYNNGPCDLTCPNEATELAAIATCTQDYDAIIEKIRVGGANGENISASCKSAETTVACLNAAGTCPKTDQLRKTEIEKYTNVSSYCNQPTTSGSSSSTSSSGDSVNTTALIIIGVLIIVIIIINIIICICIVLYRRRRKLQKMNHRARVGPEVIYQYGQPLRR